MRQLDCVPRCETLDQKGTWGQLTEFMNTALDVLDTVRADGICSTGRGC